MQTEDRNSGRPMSKKINDIDALCGGTVSLRTVHKTYRGKSLAFLNDQLLSQFLIVFGTSPGC